MSDTLQAARESFHGKTMTEAQLRKAYAHAEAIHVEIKYSGSFKKAVESLGYQLSSEEKFDAVRGEKMIRDVFTARYGQSMNKMREGLLETETRLPEDISIRALEVANRIERRIKDGPTEPFYMADDRETYAFAEALGITQRAAKSIVSQSFEQHRGTEMYAYMKQIEADYHLPVREAERAARQAQSYAARSQSRSRN